MNCDQAFDCLTDSRNREDPALQHHLADCPRCRAMRDALEPALDLFDEVAIEPDLSAEARGPRPALSSETLRLAEQTAASLSKAAPRAEGRGSWWRGGVRYAAALLIGASLTLALQNSAEDAAFPHPVSECLWRNRPADEEQDRSSRAVVARCVHCHFATPDGFGPAASTWNGELLFRVRSQRPFAPDLLLALQQLERPRPARADDLLVSGGSGPLSPFELAHYATT